MKYTISLNNNNHFKYMYKKSKSEVMPVVVVYHKRNKLKINRLGITVSTKLGNAVVRNRIRRRIKEVYRLNEPKYNFGLDYIIVARTNKAAYKDINKYILKAFKNIDEKYNNKIN